MANQITIDIGAAANDGTGDPLRTAFNYVNNNFSNVWNTGLPNSNVQFSDNRILTVNTNANLVLAPNGIGKVASNVDIVPNTANVFSLGSSTRRWNTVYAQYLDVSNNTTFGDLTVDGNLTVQGNTIQIGNIVTDTKTIQLANTASTNSAANGSGITVGASDNIATLLYNSTSNAWTTNIGVSVTGNITGNYFIGNGALLTGITAGSNYSNANVAAYLPTYSGNISAGNISVTSAISAHDVYADAGSFSGDPVTGDGSLYVGAPNFVPLGTDVMAQFTGNITNYGQLNFQNYSNSATASGDYVITADNGNDSTRFINMGMTSSTWDGTQTNVLTGLNPNNGYLYVQDGNLTLGTRAGNVSYSWKFDTTGGIVAPNLTVTRGDRTGTLTGSTLRIGNGSQEAILTTPNGVDGSDSQRLVINPGAGSEFGEGGDIYLYSGRGGASGGSGGDIKIRGGLGPADGYGGYIDITGGEAAGNGTAGYIDIIGGQSAGGAGGYVRFIGGQGQTTGGNINITGGQGITGEGGAVNIGGGVGNGLSNYGIVSIVSGTSTWQFNNTGNLVLPNEGVIYETNIPFGGLSGKTIALKPYGGTDLDQQLLVYPTAGADFNHLHLTTGNLWNTELFLGNDDYYVKLGNTGNVVINSNDGTGNSAQWTFGTAGTILNSRTLALQVASGIPTSVADWNGQGGWNQSLYANLATTGGTGTGLTVDVAAGGSGYIDINQITINTPGTGYTAGDVITIDNENNLPGTFIIGVSTPAWEFGTTGALTLPTIATPGVDTVEKAQIRGTRKIVGETGTWSTYIDGHSAFGNVAWTASSSTIQSAKITFVVQSNGTAFNWEQFDVAVCQSDSANAFVSVSGRIRQNSAIAYTEVFGYVSDDILEVWLNPADGQTAAYINYDAVEFNIMPD